MALPTQWTCSLTKLREIVKDREALVCLQSIESQRVLHDRATESQKLPQRPVRIRAHTLRPANPASILHRQAGHIKKTQIRFCQPTFKAVMAPHYSLQKVPISARPLTLHKWALLEHLPSWTSTTGPRPHPLPLSPPEPLHTAGPSDLLFLLPGMFFIWTLWLTL